MCFPGEEAAPAVSEATESSGEQTQETNVEPGAAAVEEAAAVQAVKDAKTPAEKKVAEKRLEKFMLKVDGQEIEEELDLNDKEAIKKHLQLSKAAQRRMQEKAEMEKGLTEFIDLIRKDPKRVLSHPDIGVDIKAFAQAVLQEQLEEEQKSPEQKEKEKLMKELEEYRRKEEEAKKQKELAEKTAKEKEVEEQLSNEIISALESVKLPKSERAVRYMAEYMSLALKNDVELSAQDVAPLVLKKMKEEYRDLIRGAPDEILSDFIDKDVETRLQKKRVANLKKPVESSNQIKPTGMKAQEKKVDVKKKRITDFLND